MAHADYDCCAVCDSKQGYNSAADSKAAICGPCVAEMAKRGVILGTSEEFVKWIEEHPAEEVKTLLDAVGFCPCFYPNAVDFAVKGKGLKYDR